MSKIVREHYPASKLQEELCPGDDPNAQDTITIEQEPIGGGMRPEHVMTLEEIVASRRPPYRTKEEIYAGLRQDRDEWDD